MSLNFKTTREIELEFQRELERLERQKAEQLERAKAADKVVDTINGLMKEYGLNKEDICQLIGPDLATLAKQQGYELKKASGSKAKDAKKDKRFLNLSNGDVVITSNPALHDGLKAVKQAVNDADNSLFTRYKSVELNDDNSPKHPDEMAAVKAVWKRLKA